MQLLYLFSLISDLNIPSPVIVLFIIIQIRVLYKQVAQWATIAHLGANVMFGDTIIDDAERQVTLNLKQ